jgi:predicted component of type VI protein secretion system
MSSAYKDTLEALDNGTWPVLMRHHIVREAKSGSKAAISALAMGDKLWAKIWQGYLDEGRAKVAEKEADSLRDTIQQLTDTLLELEKK